VSSTPDVAIDHLLKKKEEERAVALSRYYQFTEKKDNHLTGNVEPFNMNDFVFSEQFHKFKAFGYAHDPNGNLSVVIIDRAKSKDSGGP
jgi:pre-mRNA-processing factor 17